MASYSAFFSSGLLALPMHGHSGMPTTPVKHKATRGLSTPYSDSSPIRPESPLPSYDSDIEIEIQAQTMDTDCDPSDATPTQSLVSTLLAKDPLTKPIPLAVGPQPRIRRRRSSLTIGASPMTSIRSASRNVGVALQLQRHLASGNRSRSGSTTAPLNPSARDGSFGVFANIGLGSAGAVPSEGTSLMGRLRSGSVGNHGPLPPTCVPSRVLRRHVRRVTSVPAPAPPPSAPLPALPPSPMRTGSQKLGTRAPFSFQNNELSGSAGFSAPSKGPFKGRDRGLSVCSVGRIDEEMKEN